MLFKGLSKAQILNFTSTCNEVLKHNMSGFRFIGGLLAPITNDQEIVSIEQVLNVAESLAPVNLHLKTALDRLSDKPDPDYRNSVKESISAVESVCSHIR